MRKIISLFLLLNFMAMSSFAVNFDTSIDDTIRKNYNVEESEISLPALPNVAPTGSNTGSVQQIVVNPTGKTYTLKSGTKIILQSKTTISDRLVKGSRVSFSCSNGFLAKDGSIIPAGTIFKGKITDSHQPQLTGNGGLVELMVDEIYLNGVMSKIDTKINLANSKKVFFSNIKGKRSYWKNFAKATTPGRKVFGATQTASSVMAAIPIVNLVSFVPILGGAVFYTLNVVAAPVVAIFTKGGHITLPAGTEFEIKLTNDNTIHG